MIRVGRMYVLDGASVGIEAEGGSAKEAYSIVEAAADELGCAPKDAAPATAPKNKGGRPPKNPPPTVPALPVAPATVTGAFDPPGASVPPGLMPPDGPAPGPVATFNPAPPSGPPASGVAFAPPPAPPVAVAPPPEHAARQAVQAEYDNLLQSVPGAWQASVRQNADNLVVQAGAGASIGAMTQAQADAALTALRGYRATCDAAPR